MKTVLRSSLQSNGLFRVGFFSVPDSHDTTFSGGSVKAWLLKDGSFGMPRNEKEAAKIAELDLPASRKALDRAASAISAYTS